MITLSVCSNSGMSRSIAVRLRLNSAWTMWTYLLGPVFSLLPRPWRDLLVRHEDVLWGRAAAVSGFAEAALALYGLGRWYYYAMSTWVGNAVAVALSGQNGPEVSPQAIGAVALTIWVTHPVTLLLAYAGFEGTFRLCAGAFAGSVYGTLPLFLVDKILFGPFRGRPSKAVAPVGVRNAFSSYVGAVGESVQGLTSCEVPDELCFAKTNSGEFLEIRACRRKPDWNPPKTVRYLDAYYRLESDSRGGGSRSFLYQLRKLPAGVPGRNVLIYSPLDPVVRKLSSQSSCRS